MTVELTYQDWNTYASVLREKIKHQIKRYCSQDSVTKQLCTITN